MTTSIWKLKPSSKLVPENQSEAPAPVVWWRREGTKVTLWHFHKRAGEGHFTRQCSEKTKGNGFKLKGGQYGLDLRKKLFIMKVVKYHNRLPREVKDAPSLETFKDRLSNLI